VILLEAPEPPYKLVSNSLFPDAVARLVKAETVDATLAGELDVPVVPVLDELERLDNAEDWLVPMLPIDIMSPRSRYRNRNVSARAPKTLVWS